MTDYGHELQFGAFLTPDAAQPDRVLALAQLAEQVGLDLVTVQDHPYQARFLDTWTLLSVMAAHTSRVHLAPNVVNLPLRPPAVLARSVASLDLLSGGRVELGLGAGAFWDGIAAMGGPRLDPGEAVQALAEGVAIIRALWDADGPAVRVDGRFHRVHGAHPGPAPAHDVGIWLGAYRPRMLEMTGRLADGWLPSSPYAEPERLTDMNRRIDAAAELAGRRPGDVRRLYNVAGTFSQRGTGFLAGPAGVWVEQLAELALREGMSAFIVMGDDPDLLRRFAGEVAPGVRQLVEVERAGGQANPGPTMDAGPVTGAAASTVDLGAPRPSAPTARAGSGLRVVPTPDDRSRLSAMTVWDESARPSGPPPDPDRVYTDQEQVGAQQLVDIHDHLRSELRSVRDLIDQVTAGTLDAGAARSHISTMTMRQNNWTVGVYCESYCRVVTTHHTIEDQSVFPHLRGADPALAPVVDRLESEHRSIHDVLEGVDRALVAFVTRPGGAPALQAAVDLLTDTLLSHLSYEEHQLIEPLARFGFA